MRSERNKVERLQQPKMYVATVTARGGQGGHMPQTAADWGAPSGLPPPKKQMFLNIRLTTNEDDFQVQWGPREVRWGISKSGEIQ